MEAEAEVGGRRRGGLRDGREEPRVGMVEVLQENMRLRRGVKVVDHRFEDSVRIQLNWQG
jgi:hypothetical protein